MHSKILTLLVININQKLREARAALETEEKTREVATLQGRICGWKKLRVLLMDNYGVIIPVMDEANEAAPLIESIETREIKKLHAEMEELVKDTLWKSLLKKVAENKESLKEYLITKADCARDLYLAQAQQEGLAMYEPLFSSLKEEYERRGEELDFDAEAYEGPEEEPAEEIPPKNRIAHTTLALPPPPKKPRRKKGDKK
jgi:hypothetical protein